MFLQGVAFTGTASTFMEPHGVPSGGDWALQRTAALFFEGTERVVICASGDVQGNITAPRVMLEDGGRFKGNIDMGGTKAAAAKPAAPASAPPEVRSIDKAG